MCTLYTCQFPLPFPSFYSHLLGRLYVFCLFFHFISHYRKCIFSSFIFTFICILHNYTFSKSITFPFFRTKRQKRGHLSISLSLSSFPSVSYNVHNPSEKLFFGYFRSNYVLILYIDYIGYHDSVVPPQQ